MYVLAGLFLLGLGFTNAWGEDIGIVAQKKLIDSPLDDIQWADDRTVFIVSEKGALYRSSDGGQKFVNQASKMPKVSTVASMHVSAIDPNHIFFLGPDGQNWATTDMGRTYKFSSLNKAKIPDIRMHPTKADWLLGTKMSKHCTKIRKDRNCFKQLFVSKDFGGSWKHVTDYVVQFDWHPKDGPAMDATDDTIYATMHMTKYKSNQRFGIWDKDLSFVRSDDYFDSQIELVPHGNRFLFGENGFIFVAAVSDERDSEVTLQISRVNATGFHAAILPVTLAEHSYTILDTSEGSVFLHVNHKPYSASARTGHVYVSDGSGLVYSLSLPYNVRAVDGTCDFDKVEGLEGIYFANFLEESESNTDAEAEEKGSGGEKKKNSVKKQGRTSHKPMSVISFDKGGVWGYLKPPEEDALGQKYPCKRNCHLHLHSVTDLFGPFYSAKEATGLVMATGNVGEHLQDSFDSVNTYFSRDGGVNWQEVRKGSHIYEFGDHGGLIVIADDNVKTNLIWYSWDEGLTWTKHQISKEPFQVENIIIEPESTSQEFIVYGFLGDTGVIVYVNFDGLHERTCTGHDAPDSSTSDYENWSPSDGRTDGKCLMGHTVNYVRRKRESQCFNPDVHERKTFVNHCQCQEIDFECDYGFERSTDVPTADASDYDGDDNAAAEERTVDGGVEGGKCVPMAESPTFANIDDSIDGVCHDRALIITKGYRRVAGDTCINGEQWEGTVIPCASAWLGGAGKWALGFIMLVSISFCVATTARKTAYFDGMLSQLKSQGYRAVGGGFTPSMADDEGYYLNDDQFEENQDEIEDNSISFQPLEPIVRNNQAVPILVAPPDDDDAI